MAPKAAVISSSVRGLLREGVGWGNMPLPMIEPDLAAGTLVRLAMPDRPGGTYRLAGVSRRDSPPGPAATRLLNQFVRYGARTAKNQASPTSQPQSWVGSRILLLVARLVPRPVLAVTPLAMGLLRRRDLDKFRAGGLGNLSEMPSGASPP